MHMYRSRDACIPKIKSCPQTLFSKYSPPNYSCIYHACIYSYM